MIEKVYYECKCGYKEKGIEEKPNLYEVKSYFLCPKCMRYLTPLKTEVIYTEEDENKYYIGGNKK